MAIRVEYTITSGTLDITVELLDGVTVIDTNVHSAYGTYSFEDVPNGNYSIKFTGADGCYGIEDITVCDSCPPGYTAYPETCVLYNEEAPTYYATTFTVLKKANNTAYSIYGALLFDTWNYDGTGTFEQIGISPLNTYWANQPYPSTTGVMNRSSVWASTTYNYQDIGFSVCIDIAIGKYYYVGFGCDNWGKIKLNGTLILEQDVAALASMVTGEGLPIGADSTAVTFKYWFIYPIYLPAGQNVIEVLGHNEAISAAVGIEVYDATRDDLINATSDADLTGQILFRSSDLVGDPLHYEYSVANGYHGYICNAGYALNTCGTEFLCIQRDEIPCGYTTTTTTAPPTTTTTTTQGVFDIEYGLLYNWYAVTDAREITSSDDWEVAPYSTAWFTLISYAGGSSVAGQALKEVGTDRWNSPNTGTNTYGFTAVGGGVRDSGTGAFAGIGADGTHWTSTQSSASFAICPRFQNTSDATNAASNNKKQGSSVRLVKDATGIADGVTTTYTGNDGKIYLAVCIDEQYWTVSNLAETRFRNGDIIPWYGASPASYFTNGEWAALVTAGVCAYNNDENNVGTGFNFPMS